MERNTSCHFIGIQEQQHLNLAFAQDTNQEDWHVGMYVSDLSVATIESNDVDVFFGQWPVSRRDSRA